MPLTKRQFELRIDEEMENWMRQAYILLKDHPDLAYSVDELELTVLGADKESWSGEQTLKFRRALDVLDGISAVEKRQIGDTDHYAFLQEFDTNTWARDLSLWKL